MCETHQVIFCYALKLMLLWYLAHSAQAARADIHCTRSPIDFEAAAMYVEYKAAACTMLRKRYVVAVHRLTFTYITATCGHCSLPP